MLDRDGYGRHRPIIVRCDCCGESFDTLTPDVAVAKERAERRGWRFELKKRVWLHTCNECVGDEDDGA